MLAHAFNPVLSTHVPGIGIPLEKQSLLFRPFSQVDSSTTRVYGGTGLGLVISAKLATTMGGSMWVESQEGEGSNFFFTAAFQLSGKPPAQRSAALLEALKVRAHRKVPGRKG